eukprot:Sro2853_g338660.2  (209) ;mRNA; r:3962-4588
MNLFTPWKDEDGKACQDVQILVYHCLSNKKTVLQYVSNSGQQGSGTTDGRGRFNLKLCRLEMNRPGNKFNGANGRLFGMDSKLIEVHTGRRVYPADDKKQSETVIDVRDYKLVSVKENLFTPWKERWDSFSRDLPVLVYERISDNRIVLRYLTGANANDDEYEGLLETEKYTLKMDWPGAEFDGANGVLFDANGKVIDVHIGKRFYHD